MTASSHKKVWWLCEKGHEWEVTVNSRAKGIGCPFCSGKRVCADNSLQTLNPNLAIQWHPTKNGDLTPDDVTTGSDKKVWWQCNRGHEWEATITSRTRGNGCSICNQGTQTSFPEQAIYFYFKNVFDDALNRYRFNNKWEIDIFVPHLDFGIEYDGIYFHQDKEIFDSDKEKYIANEGVFLLRVKETERKTTRCFLKNNTIYCDRRPSEIQLNDLIKMSFEYISDNITHQPYFPDVDVERDRTKIYSLYTDAEEEQSLLVNYPELSKQWHPTKNLSIKPDMVKSGSNKKVWWQCEKGHEWEARIQNRASGDGCPFCIGKRVCADNSLQTLNPDLANQWHPIKNGSLTPNDVTISSSSKKVWWICEKGHEWEALVNSRALLRSRCPYCSGNRACDDNSLQTLNPGLTKQWHPTKNGDLTPNEVTTGSSKKVWWICEKGHEWEASISSRAISGNGCTFCSGKRVCDDNSLKTLNPELSKQWHPIKNDDLTPNNVTIGSGKKVWWQCEKGHEWEARIADRARGKGCPYCRKLKRKN